jgi:hypothetical protein
LAAATSWPHFGLETLELRRLFNGVTLITHGYQATSSDRPAWLNYMAAAVAASAGADTAIYNLRVARTGDGSTAQVVAFDRLVGSSPTSAASADAETVIMLDWADASGVALSGWSTSSIARLVAPYLTSAIPQQGIDYPLAQGPIHLIGHSRGGSLVSALADDLAQQGIWVDQLTTLDPHPVGLRNDAAIIATANVVFADNYYQTSNIITGERVDGAHNVGPLALGGVHSALDGGSHSDVHSWYFGTTSALETDGDITIPTSWYNVQGQGPRNGVGYVYSRIAGGTRPADGLASQFGGTGLRYAASSHSGAQWPNVGQLDIQESGSQFRAGAPLTVNLGYEDADSAPVITFFLDTDRNPYDGGGAYQVREYTASQAGAFDLSNISLNTAGVPAGQYYLVARVSDGTHTRFSYIQSPITLTNPPPVQPPTNPPPTSPPPTNPPPPTTPAPAQPDGPDLTGSVYYAPASLYPGVRNNPLGLTITNAGNLPMRGSVNVGIYASTDTTFDGSDVLVGASLQKLNLLPGRSKVTVLKFNSPANVPDGNYHLMAVMDWGASWTERDETNNVAVAQDATNITAPFVDLAPSFVSWPSPLRRGKRSTATVRVTNTGNVIASGSFSLQVNLSPDNATGAGATRLGSVFKAAKIKPGASLLVKVPISLGTGSGGYLQGVFNYVGSPADRDTADNVLFSTTPITAM